MILTTAQREHTHQSVFCDYTIKTLNTEEIHDTKLQVPRQSSMSRLVNFNRYIISTIEGASVFFNSESFDQQRAQLLILTPVETKV